MCKNEYKLKVYHLQDCGECHEISVRFMYIYSCVLVIYAHLQSIKVNQMLLLTPLEGSVLHLLILYVVVKCQYTAAAH